MSNSRHSSMKKVKAGSKKGPKKVNIAIYLKHVNTL